ncbi:hypothetical protein HK101_006640, partial [Irineochytrium annulatum]
AAEYRAILNTTSNILDRLGSARAAMGMNPPFSDAVVAVTSGAFRTARADVQASVRMLLYVFSTALIAKQPLPGDLPEATRARNVVFRAFWRFTERLVVGEEGITEAMAERWGREQDEAERAEGGEEEVGEVKAIVKREEDEEAMGRTAGIKEALRSESWLRFYSFAMAMRMLSVDVDALTPHFRSVFGAMPAGFKFPEEQEKGRVSIQMETALRASIQMETALRAGK